MDKKLKVGFYLKNTLRSYFEETAAGDLLFGFLNSAAKSMGSQNVPDDEWDKTISTNLIPLDQLVSHHYQTTTVKRGRKEVSKTKKPNPIRASPLYTKGEMELFQLLTKPIFTDLMGLEKDYEYLVFNQGFDAIERKISEIISLRWQTLSRFAKTTKERLQDIRRISGEATLKKANVTVSHVSQFENQLVDPARRLVNEMKHTLGAVSFSDMIGLAFKIKVQTEQDATRYFYIKALDMYKSTLTGHPRIAQLTTDPVAGEVTENDFDKAVICLSKLSVKLGALRRQSLGFSNMRYFKIPGRVKQVVPISKSIIELVNEFDSLPENAREAAEKLYSFSYIGSELSPNQVKTEVIYSVEQILKKLRNRVRNGDARDSEPIFDDAIRNLKSLHTECGGSEDILRVED
jgi:hypothetical protein